jgi:hypothetical protein
MTQGAGESFKTPMFANRIEELTGNTSRKGAFRFHSGKELDYLASHGYLPRHIGDQWEWDTFQDNADESEWFNWDVVARALGIQEGNEEGQLWSFLRNEGVVGTAFLRPTWAKTRDLLHKIEADKRREFMEGQRVPAHA